MANANDVEREHDPNPEFTKYFWGEKAKWAAAGDRVCSHTKRWPSTDQTPIHAIDDCPQPTIPVRVDGKHYCGTLEMVCYTVGRAAFLGFGGAVWYIEFTSGPHAGRLAMTNDLWHQGDIPANMQDVMPNNARFHTKETYQIAIDAKRAAVTATAQPTDATPAAG